jgi:hypothetical protein
MACSYKQSTKQQVLIVIIRHNGLRSRGPCYSTGTTSDTTKTTLNAQRNNIILGVSALLALSGLISYRRGKRLQHDAKVSEHIILLQIPTTSFNHMYIVLVCPIGATY